MFSARGISVSNLAIAVTAMAVVVVASNFLVQYPVEFVLGGVNLADLLTWGAFTYPAAFLVTDLTNRRFGPDAARIVVVIGFAIAVMLSIWLATPRIAIASGTAFLAAQLFDVTIFDELRRKAWWKAPFISSMIGSVLDTILFFGIAFSVPFAFVDSLFGMEDGSLAFPVPFLGLGADVPLWISLAAGDFIVKSLVAIAMLAPYRVVLAVFRPMPENAAT